jgi:fluoride ion exporter CrcB/FEX
MTKYVCVLTRGGFGSLARYLLGRAIVQLFPPSLFESGTFVIDVTGISSFEYDAYLATQRGNAWTALLCQHC